ncbi:ribosome small subunit-dependent GTPase A [Schnuerera sp. xch1]|uniref:ribosome small subunit-dependent GTPase A n=1 Tax=Schnuerera sp. xch1 TaxID=2874283 RepID=UPI001CBF9B78|nr:ribosome small subunit-dependent GTPase A [Schnuerera sp. xch1]MBZ2173923.1 ribosome small subunit-dependent GTPase A [Schnuerera sp. xch1]
MIEGIIIKGIGGFYYVKTKTDVYECRARGIFREKNITPLVGDNVLIRISDEDNTGYIEKIKQRKSKLTRPPVANITQAIIIMSVKEPALSYWLLDRFLIMAEHENLDIGICINKIDRSEQNEINKIYDIYNKISYSILKTSAKTGEGIDDLKQMLKHNITVFAGPSGVGKSSLLNKIDPRFELKTGDVSKKTSRGKHTTRHVELFNLDSDSYVLDTPGFSSLNLDFIEDEIELSKYFKEIYRYGDRCKFSGCLHYKEPCCEVKMQVEEGNISSQRYDNYIQFLKEIKNNRRY